MGPSGWLAFLASVVAASALAAPCTDDHWQPTYVRDLICDDGASFYVMPDGSFSELTSPVEESAAAQCTQHGVRDRAGFSTCAEYTRVQCGCGAASWSNSTCARFLEERGHANPKGATPAARRKPTDCRIASLLVFCSSQSKPCVELAPTLDRLSAEGVCLRRLSVPANASDAARYRVDVMPTVVGLRCGQEAGRVTANDEKAIRELWTKLTR